jgi:hypothetical protein
MSADRWSIKIIIVAGCLGEMLLMMIFPYSIGQVTALVSFGTWTALGTLDTLAISAFVGIITKRRGEASPWFSSTRSITFCCPRFYFFISPNSHKEIQTD